MTILDDFSKFYHRLPKRIVIIGGVSLIIILFLINYIYYQNQTKSKAGGETVFLTFSPPSVQAGSGQTFTTLIKAKPSVDINIRGYNLYISFGKAALEVKNISYKLGVVSAGLGDDASTLSQVNSSGMIKLIGEIQSATGHPLSSSQASDVVELTFASKGSSASSVVVDNSTSKFSLIQADYTLVPIPAEANDDLKVNSGEEGLSPTGELTGTPPSTGAATFNLKLKFQGILNQPSTQYNNLRVKLTALSSAGIKSEGTGDFTADNQGIWSGSVTLESLPCFSNSCSGFKLYIKGPKHLQKKICSVNPDDQKIPGSYYCKVGESLTISSGVNNFDFSKVYLLVGDTNQDGLVDSYDASLLRNNLGKSDAEILKLADFNLDGIVDTQDYSLLIAALSIRYDEE